MNAKNLNQSQISTEEKRFYSQSREIVRDLFEPNSRLYWLDFSLSVTAAYTSASIFLSNPLDSLIAWVSCAVAVFTLYRASMFVHEVVHINGKEMNRFKWFWNLFAGVPMMVPSFAYESHLHHHNTRHYGTEQDGEYLPLGSGSLWGIAVFLFQIFFQPLLVFARFLIGTPVSFLHPGLRRWFVTHASSLVINFKYERDAKLVEKVDGEALLIEWLCWLRATTMIGLVLFGVMPWVRLPKMLLLAMLTLALNHYRTLAAHRYKYDGKTTVSHLDQFQDSTNITGNWLTELLCPCGLRYHALHHLFPSIPYHNLGIAHRRLLEKLPANSLYHQSVYPNTFSVIRELVAKITKRNSVI